MVEEYAHTELTSLILGAAFDVHGSLGPGFLEKIYEQALVHELRLRQIPVAQQVRVPIRYKSKQVGLHTLDLVADGKVIIELKSIDSLTQAHKAITLSYLATTKLEVALLLNFKNPRLEYRRIARIHG
jgi:GxxExxY protein